MVASSRRRFRIERLEERLAPSQLAALACDNGSKAKGKSVKDKSHRGNSHKDNKSHGGKGQPKTQVTVTTLATPDGAMTIVKIKTNQHFSTLAVDAGASWSPNSSVANGQVLIIA
jgi:hypothetical protein